MGDGKIKYAETTGKILYSVPSGKISIECPTGTNIQIWELSVKVVAPVILNSHQGTWSRTAVVTYTGTRYASGVGGAIVIDGTSYWNINPEIRLHGSGGPFDPPGWWFHVLYRFNDGTNSGFDGFFHHMPDVETVTSRIVPDPPDTLEYLSPEGDTDNLFGNWQFGQNIW